MPFDFEPKPPTVRLVTRYRGAVDVDRAADLYAQLREARGELEAAGADGLPRPDRARRPARRPAQPHDDVGRHADRRGDGAGRAGAGPRVPGHHDHSATHGFGDHVTADQLRARIGEIRELNEQLDGFQLLIGTETNILPDGSPDYPDELLADLDWVIASIHTSFGMGAKKMTDRLVAAIEHPLVDAIGHPTGRKIEKRQP